MENSKHLLKPFGNSGTTRLSDPSERFALWYALVLLGSLGDMMIMIEIYVFKLRHFRFDQAGCYLRATNVEMSIALILWWFLRL